MADVALLIERVLTLDPAAPAIEFEGKWATYAQLARTIRALREQIDVFDLPAGARVGVMLRNRPAHVATLYALLVSGRCLVTINPHFPDAAVADDIAALGLPLIVGSAADLDRPGVSAALATNGTGSVVLPESLGGLSAIAFEGDPALHRNPASPDVMIEMLTSGTTGTPKRVPLSRKAFQRSFDAAIAHDAGPDGRLEPKLRPGVTIMSGPLTHIGGIWGAITTAAAGRRMVLLEKFAVEPWRRAVATYRPPVAGATSAALRMILDADLPSEDLASLKALVAGAAAIAPEVVDRFRDKYGIAVLGNYGATEFAGPVASWTLRDFNELWASKRGSSGRLHRGVEARIVGLETGEPVPAMSEGLLELRSSQLPDPDQWLRTTDLARLDEDGFLWITGRADGAINRGGFKIQPQEVVRQIEAHSGVREAVVVGIPDDRLGAVPAAAVIRSVEGRDLTETELNVFLRERLLPYQIPAVIRMVDDLPRTASMKPMLAEVAAMLGRERGPSSAGE